MVSIIDASNNAIIHTVEVEKEPYQLAFSKTFAYVRSMGDPVMTLIDYTVLVSAPQMFTRLPGIGARVPPIYNVIISNVPGPRDKLYFLGAEMDSYFPISALAHGQALNVTVMSYAGGLYFGVTACPERVPSVQRLAVYTGEALDELEEVFVRGRAPATRSVGRKTTSGPRRLAAAGKPRSAPGGPRRDDDPQPLGFQFGQGHGRA